MGVIRLGICIGGVYAAFLLWAIAQERLAAPFLSTTPSSSLSSSTSNQSTTNPPPTQKGDRFPSPLFLNYAQALASCLSALSYLLVTSWRSGELGRRGWRGVLGFDALREGWRGATSTGGERRGTSDSSASPSPVPERRRSVVIKSPAVVYSPIVGGAVRRGSAQVEKGQVPLAPGSIANGVGNGVGVMDGKDESVEIPTLPKPGVKGAKKRSLPILLAQVSTFQTIAGPIGFLALRHISFPTMVLGKSCKLIPVMLLNVLLYRRRFSAHKYVVVGLVTAGISIFMLLAPKKAGKGGGSDSLWGLSLLIFNLMVDGLTNATQDQIFALYPNYTGQQMMFHMSLLAQLFLLPLMLLPLPSSPLSILTHIPLLSTLITPYLPPSTLSTLPILSPPAFLTSLSFLYTHPTALPPLLAYALLGGLGQLFIFETIQHFGSLTLTMVTVTRKLFTMLLSVIVFEHQLTGGQWVGVGVVFAGIGVEAGVKRREVMRKARRD